MIHRVRRPQVRIVSCLTSAILVSLIAPLSAQDAAPPERLTVDDQSVDPLPSDAEAETLPEIAGRILAGMQDATDRLVERELNEETVELQERINSDLARLLKALEEQASPPSSVSDEQSQGDSQSSSTGGTGDQGGIPGDSSTASESSEGDRPGELSDAELEHRRNLATSVWGHLPERERDEMLGTFSERFLPAYDELVRKYYEALSARRREER